MPLQIFWSGPASAVGVSETVNSKADKYSQPPTATVLVIVYVPGVEAPKSTSPVIESITKPTGVASNIPGSLPTPSSGSGLSSY